MSAAKPHLAFLFPGSGSQTLGMGRDFNRDVPEVRRFLDALACELGYDLRRTMFEGPHAALFRPIDHPEPSLFIEVTSALSLAIAHALERHDIRPDALAGRSMGEYTALMASGAATMREGFALMRAVGLSAQADCRRQPSELLTIYGLTRTQSEELCAEVAQKTGVCELVTHLSHRCITVVGGTLEAVADFERRARELNVTRMTHSSEAGAFHTSLMRPHAAFMARELAHLRLRRPTAPIWCDYDGRPTMTTATLRRNLAAQLDHPVLWQEVIYGLLNAGVRTFVEIGPGRMLTEFVFDLPSDARVLPTDTPENLAQTVRALRPRHHSKKTGALPSCRKGQARVRIDKRARAAPDAPLSSHATRRS